MSKTYTARLCGNKRDTKLSTPKALLIEIVDADGELFRDHCWVKISKLLERYQPKAHKRPIKIKFKAEVKEYVRHDGPSKTLSHIDDIKVIQRT